MSSKLINVVLKYLEYVKIIPTPFAQVATFHMTLYPSHHNQNGILLNTPSPNILYAPTFAMHVHQAPTHKDIKLPTI